VKIKEKNNTVKFFSGLGIGKSELKADLSRLEAFLESVPLDYCGWSSDGSIAYSKGFINALKLPSIKSINDIEQALSPSDAAALEGLFIRLQEHRESFSIRVSSLDKSKTFKLSGKIGKGSEQDEEFLVLWLDDISSEELKLEQASVLHDQIEDERNRLQTAFDNVPIPLWMRDINADIISCNRAYALALDSTPATVIAEQIELPLKYVKKKNVIPPGKPLAINALETEKIISSRAHVILSGKRILMEITEIPLSSLGITLGIADDVTREEELETEHKRYASANKELLEQLGTAIGIYGADEKLEFYNSAFSQLWDLEDSYLNSKPKLGELMEKLRVSRRLPEQADFKQFKKNWLDMFTRLINPHEEMLYLPDATALRMLVVPHPMGGLMMTFEDVTSRLELESSYNTLIAVQRETLDNLSEGVAVYGGDGRLKLSNPAYTRLWKLNPEDTTNEPHITKIVEKMKPFFLANDWLSRQKNLLAQALDRNIIEGRMERSDGKLIAYSTRPLPDGGVLVTHIDVTDTVKVENALREKNAALEAAEQLKLDFLANVSYQLRTPLNAIMGFAEILDNEYFGKLTSKQKEYTLGIEEAGERLISLVDDILDLSTIEAGYLELDKEEFSVWKTLKALHELTCEWARKDKIEVTLECPKNIGKIVADKRRIKQVLLNLIRNAITFTPSGGIIKLSATKDNSNFIFSVSDTGSGIPVEDQKRIFEPFERASGSLAERRGPRGGAGLGLTLVKNIVELHGGSLGLDSEPGKGTTITVTLPKET
jgi:signal transduction histidine kinase